MEYYAGIKSNWELIYTKLWKNFEKIMLSKRSQLQGYISLFIENIQNLAN